MSAVEQQRTEQLRAVVVGTGFGARVHVPALRLSGFEVAALVGVNLARTAERAAECKVAAAFTQLEEALVVEPNVVIIASPATTHYELTRKALLAGCHVLCEKPFTLNADEALELKRLAVHIGRVGFVGHEFRFIPSHALTARLIAEGAIGEPRLATLIDHRGTLAGADLLSRPGWFFDPNGGGWLMTYGSHVVDQLRVWFGDLDTVSGRLQAVGDRPNTADESFSFHFTSRSGVQGTVAASDAAWGKPFCHTRILGTHGSLAITDEYLPGARVILADRSGERDVEVPDNLQLSMPIDSEPTKMPPYFERNVLPYARLYDEFRDAIHGSSSAHRTVAATFSDGVAEMRILDAIIGSSEAGGTRVSIGANKP